jgi:hypothetical protein
MKENVTKMKHSQFFRLFRQHQPQHLTNTANLIFRLPQYNTATKDQNKNITAPF